MLNDMTNDQDIIETIRYSSKIGGFQIRRKESIDAQIRRFISLPHFFIHTMIFPNLQPLLSQLTRSRATADIQNHQVSISGTPSLNVLKARGLNYFFKQKRDQVHCVCTLTFFVLRRDNPYTMSP